MNKSYSNLFKPLTVKNITFKNRVAMTPMGTNFAKQNGEIGPSHINYYKQRAKGGAGLIIVENACIDFPLGSNGTTQLRIDQDNYLPSLFKLCETVHEYGTKISIQINHAGASAVSARTGMQPASASNIPSKKGGEIPRPLTKEELQEIAEKYGQAAQRAKTAGFDSIEVHGGHSYLISQFLSPLTNDRTDEFGGSPENRARFAKLVMSEVRKAVGPNFPIMIRISADELLEGGNSLEDTLILLEYFQEEADIIDVSAGLNDSIYYQIDANYLEDGWRSYMAKAVREKFNKPVITTGNIRSPRVAEEILANGDSDFIGMGRGLIADPEWVNKVEFGAEENIRKCISCNIGCAGHRIKFNRPIRCTVNPDINGENDYQGQSIKKDCNVVVIGGGTAGLEAACTAAEVGCTTFIIEKEQKLGGLVNEISQIPDKKRLSDFPKYLVNRAKQLNNLFAITETEADTDFIEKLNPDIIVNATGSQPLLPPITGLNDLVDKEDSKIASISGMINQIDQYPQDLSDKEVVVIGGGAVGLDVVEFFAPRNAKVSIVEMQSTIGKDLDPVTEANVSDIIKDHKVKKLLNTKLLEVKENSFIVENDEGKKELTFDYGFVCLGMKSNNPVLEELHEKFDSTDIEIMNIGDSVRARKIIDGVHEGRNILKILAKRNYL